MSILDDLNNASANINPADTPKLNAKTNLPEKGLDLNSLVYAPPKGGGRYTGAFAQSPIQHGYKDLKSYTDYGLGLSAYTDLDEQRALNQSVGEKWGRGLIKAGVTTAGAVVENTLGILAGLGEMASGGQYYDNFVGKAVDDTNEYFREAFPNYYTKAEMDPNRSLMSSLGTANFWADKALNGLGYTVGSIATMYLTGGFGPVSGAVNLMSKGTLAAKTAARLMAISKAGKSGLAALKTGKTLSTAMTLTKIGNAARMAEAGAMMSLAEASVESRESKNRILDALVQREIEETGLKNKSEISPERLLEFENEAIAGANATFGINMAVLSATNLAMFNHLIKPGYIVASKLPLVYNKAAGEAVVRRVGSELPGWMQKTARAAKYTSPFIKGSIVENIQESSQYAATEAAILRAESNIFDGGHVDMIEALAYGLEKAYGTTEGLEQGLIGSIVGLVGGSGGVVQQYKKDKEVQARIDKVIGVMSDNVVNDALNILTADQRSEIVAQMDQALEANDHKTYNDLKGRLMANLTNFHVRNGSYEVFVEQLEQVGKLDEAEFKKLLQLPENQNLQDLGINSPVEYANDLIDKTKKVQKRIEQIEAVFQDPAQRPKGLITKLATSKEEKAAQAVASMEQQLLKNHLLNLSIAVDFSKGRMESIANEIINTESTEFSTLVEDEKGNLIRTANTELTLEDIEKLAKKVLNNKKVAEAYEDLQKARKEFSDNPNNASALLKVIEAEKYFNEISKSDLQTFVDENFATNNELSKKDLIGKLEDYIGLYNTQIEAGETLQNLLNDPTRRETFNANLKKIREQKAKIKQELKEEKELEKARSKKETEAAEATSTKTKTKKNRKTRETNAKIREYKKKFKEMTDEEFEAVEVDDLTEDELDAYNQVKDNKIKEEKYVQSLITNIQEAKKTYLLAANNPQLADQQKHEAAAEVFRFLHLLEKVLKRDGIKLNDENQKIVDGATKELNDRGYSMDPIREVDYSDVESGEEYEAAPNPKTGETITMSTKPAYKTEDGSPMVTAVKARPVKFNGAVVVKGSVNVYQFDQEAYDKEQAEKKKSSTKKPRTKKSKIDPEEEYKDAEGTYVGDFFKNLKGKKIKVVKVFIAENDVFLIVKDVKDVENLNKPGAKIRPEDVNWDHNKKTKPPKSKASKTSLANTKGMFHKPLDAANTFIYVDTDGAPAIIDGRQTYYVEQTDTEGNPIKENRSKLESPNITIGSKLTLKAIETKEFLDEYEKADKKSPEYKYNVPIYIIDEDGDIVGVLPTYSASSKLSNKEKIKQFRRKFTGSKEVTITDKKVQSNSNLNRSKTQDGKIYYYNPSTVFGKRYVYNTKTERFEYKDAPIILMSADGKGRWSFNPESLEQVSEDERAKIERDLAESQVPTGSDLKPGVIGILATDPQKGTYKIVPVTTKNLSEAAIAAASNYLASGQIDKFGEIVALSSLETASSMTNPSFLKFATFYKKRTGEIADVNTGEIITDIEQYIKDNNLNEEDANFYRNEFEEATSKSESVIYMYSATKAAITNGNGIVSISIKEFKKALNGEEFNLKSVELESKNVKGKKRTTFRQDNLDEESVEEIKESLLADLNLLLRSKKYNVNVARANALVNRRSRYISKVTGHPYNNYQEYLFSNEEGLEQEENELGHSSILVTNIYKDEQGAIHHDIGLEFSDEKITSTKEQAETSTTEQGPKPAANQTPVSTDAKAGVRADVILPIGTSGSGKSTFIKSLPQKNLVVISLDDMRVEFTGDINNKSKDKEIYEEATRRAIAAIKQGKQVVFDTTNLTKEKRRPFIEAIKKAIPNANIQYKLMELNPELAKQRIKAQIARGENRANVSDETIDRHAASYPQMLEDIKTEGITEYKPPVSTNIEAQKADIQSRMEDSLYVLTEEDLERGEDVGLIEDNGVWGGAYYNSENVLEEYFEGTKEEVIEKITARYNEELAALESQPTQESGGLELKYSPVDMSNYGKTFSQADISEGGKKIIFNPSNQPFKIKDGILTTNINDADGKTFYPISVDLSNTPEYLDYQNKKDILDAERKKLKAEGVKGINDMLRGMTASMEVAKRQMLNVLNNELKKKNSVALMPNGEFSQPTQQTSEETAPAPVEEKEDPFFENKDEDNDASAYSYIESELSEKDKIKEEAARAYIESRFPGMSTVFFDKAREIGKGYAQGWFSNMSIYLWRNAEQGTQYHEAFHGVFRMYLNNNQRVGLYEEARKSFSKEQIDAKIEELNTIYNNLSEQEISELALEELMADKFKDYVLTMGEDVEGLGNKIAKFFKDLYLFIKSMFTDSFTMNEVFRIANEKAGSSMLGKVKAKMLRNSEIFAPQDKAYAYKEGLKDQHVKERASMISAHIEDVIDDIGLEEFNKVNALGETGLIPMWYFRHAFSKMEDGVRVPLEHEEAVRLFKIRKKGDRAAYKSFQEEVVGFKNLLPEVLADGSTMPSAPNIKAAFENIALDWMSTTDGTKFENVTAKGWSEFVKEELAKRGRKLKMSDPTTRESELADDADEEFEKLFNLGSEQIDPRSKLSAKVKQIIAKIKSNNPNHLGFSYYLEPSLVYRQIVAAAVNSNDYFEFKNNLNKKVNTFPELKDLIDTLEELPYQEKAAIRHNFALNANKFFTVRAKRDYDMFGMMTGIRFELFSPDRRSVVEDSKVTVKDRAYEYMTKNTSAIYSVEKTERGFRWFGVKKENAKKLFDAYKKFYELYDGRASEEDLVKAAAKLLNSLGITYGDNLSQSISNLKKIAKTGMTFPGQQEEVKGRAFITALMNPPGGTVSIDYLVEGIIDMEYSEKTGNLVYLATNNNGTSVFEEETSTLTHLLQPFTYLKLPFTNSFVGSKNRQKYPVNTPKTYDVVERAITRNSAELREAFLEDEVFTPYEGIHTLFGFLFLTKPQFRKMFEFRYYDGFVDGDNARNSRDYKDQGKRTSYVVRLNAYLNNGSTNTMQVMLPVPGDKQSMVSMLVPRFSNKIFGNYYDKLDYKKDVIRDLLYADLMKVAVTRNTVQEAIAEEDETGRKRTNEEIAESLSTLSAPFHYPGKTEKEIDFANATNAAKQIRDLRDNGELGTGEKFSVFSVLSDAEVINGQSLSDMIEEFMPYEAGEETSLSEEEIKAFKKVLEEQVDAVMTFFEEEAAATLEEIEGLDISEQDLDSDSRLQLEDYNDLEALVSDFVFDSVVYKLEFAKAFKGGVEFAGDPTTFYKRMSTMGTPGPTFVTTEELGNDPDGYGMLTEYNEIALYDFGWVNNKEDQNTYRKDIFNLAKAVKERNQEIGDLVEKSYKADEIEGVDGTTLISMEMYRRLRMGEGKWDEILDEEAYANYKESGEFVTNDGQARPIYILKPVNDTSFLLGGKITPFVDKTAYVPISAELTAQRPALDIIRRRMESIGEFEGLPEVHVASFVSAKKLARQNTITAPINNEKKLINNLKNAKHTVMPSNSLRVAQPAVEKGKLKTKVQRQFRKNIIANIIEGNDYFIGGLEFDGKDVFDLFQGAISQKIKNSSKAFAKEMGITEFKEAIMSGDLSQRLEAKEKFMRKVKKVMLEEIEERDLNQNYVEALALVEDELQGIVFNVPLSMPSLERKFENIFFALFKNRVLKQEIKGFEIPQIAEIGGFVTDKGVNEKLKFTRVKGEKVISAEIAITEDIAKKMGLGEGDVLSLPEANRTLVGFRVPNQGMSSMVVFKIARILPKSYEKAVMVPTPLTKLMGSDFDIDKMFLMFPEVNSKTGQRIKADYKKIIETKDFGSLSSAELNNMMLDVAEAILLNPEHLVESVRPLDAKTLSDIRDKIVEKVPSFSKNLDESNKEVVEFNSIRTEIEMEMRNKLGIRNRGIYANAIAGRNIAVFGDVKVSLNINVNGESRNYVTRKSVIDPLTYNFLKNDLKISILQEDFTDFYMSQYLSAAVDAAKDPLQYYLNDTPATTAVTTLLLSNGVDPATISFFLAQPIIRDIADMYINEEATPSRMMDIAATVFETYETGADFESLMEAFHSDTEATVDLNTIELYESMDNSLMSEEFEEDDEMSSEVEAYKEKQVEHLYSFLKLFNEGRSLTAAYKVIAADNTSNVGQSAGLQTYLDNYDSLIYGEPSIQNLNSILIQDKYPFIKTYIQSYKDILDVSQLLFNSFTNGMYAFKDKLKMMTNRDTFTEEQHNMIHKAVNMHIMTGPGSPLAKLLSAKDIDAKYFGVVRDKKGKPVVDKATGEQVIDEDLLISTELEKIKNKYPLLANTSFIAGLRSNFESLVTDDMKSTYNYLTLLDRPEDSDMANEMISVFEDMLFNPEIFISRENGVYTNKAGKALGKKEFDERRLEIIKFAETLIQNNLISKGFGMGAGSYADLIPVRWISESGLSEHIRKAELELENFNSLDEFLHNFMRTSGVELAPKVSSEEIDEEAFTITLDTSSGVYNSRRGTFATYVSGVTAYGEELYTLVKIQGSKKGGFKALYNKTMIKGAKNKFFEHNFRDNSNKIDNDKSILRIGKKEEVGMFTTSYYAKRVIYNETLKDSDQTYAEKYFNMPIEEGRKNKTIVTKKCN